jgi:DNA-3-methyladenine glycosylase II
LTFSFPKTPAGALLPRRAPKESAAFWLKVVPPFRLDLTAWALRRRASNLIDRWDGCTYRRVLMVSGKPVEAAITQAGPPDDPRLRVALIGRPPARAEKAAVRKLLERLLGIEREMSGFYQLAACDPRLAPLVERFRGLKPPRFPTLFEALANAIACQQLSLSLGILLLSRLAERFGPTVKGSAGKAHAFPGPEDLAGLEPESLRRLGFSLQKGRALIGLARAFGDRSQDWDTLETLDNQAAAARMLELRGVGRWSAEYALLRGLGRPDVYPGDDVGARNNLMRWLGLRKPPDYERVRRITAKWQPYAGLVYFHCDSDSGGRPSKSS